MTATLLAHLSDRELLDATTQAAGRERRSTADLLVLLAEVDTRKLYLGEGYSSLFMYCTQVLRLSEPAAYSRIAAARAVRRFPVIVTQLAGGDITLTTIGLLAAHLTADNHMSLLDAVRHKSKRDVERLVAYLYPTPDVRSSLRRLAEPLPDRVQPPPSASVATPTSTTVGGAPGSHSVLGHEAVPRPVTRPPVPRSLVAPLASERYLLRVTISGEARRKLERARDLLRHSIPDGDPAAIVDRALTALVEQLERRKAGATSRRRVTPATVTPATIEGQSAPSQRPGRAAASAAGPQPAAKSQAATMSPTAAGRDDSGARSRTVPAAVRRAVWSRDEGRCAYVGAHGRCHETGYLEFHHVLPFADGGPTTVGNLELRCRAHNAHEARLYFGP